nr:(deoxy)nucleoside triphosphate pyrophosphohydrolase [Paraoerskovia marina]
MIIRDGMVLCAQRGPGGSLAGLWEFPGGKIEPGESPEVALVREIDEELGCAIAVGERVAYTEFEYDFGTVALATFYCRITGQAPTNREHTSIRWVKPADLDALGWAPADIPAVDRIKARYGA